MRRRSRQAKTNSSLSPCFSSSPPSQHHHHQHHHRQYWLERRPPVPPFSRQRMHISSHHECAGDARAQAGVGGPTQTVRRGEEGCGAHPGQRAQRLAVHEFPHAHMHRDTRARDMGQETGLPALRHRLRCGPGQRVEVPLSVLQKRRRWVRVKKHDSWGIKYLCPLKG